ncbi:MAG TPA: hypothetical protein DDW51_05465 [Cyanobacteria bacterium UBA11367]|nr:hypothetical protein [Cyanobacteria bacterium UBA11367]HBE56780.1 hypothetical protein [Cyanobacteria bacterium UBA11366]HBK83948.1 hypothetical protein [Flavobacterium sp.]
MRKSEWDNITINPIHLIREDGTHGGYWCRETSPGCRLCSSKSIIENPKLTYSSYMMENMARLTRPTNIWICTRTDIFGDWVQNEWLLHIFKCINQTPKNRYYVSSKYDRRNFLYNLRWVQDEMNWIPSLKYGEKKPMTNLYIGITVENQKMFDERIGRTIYSYEQSWHFLAQQGWKIFYNCTPLLSIVDLKLKQYPVSGVIVSGEIGGREVPEDAVIYIKNQCDRAGIPFFFSGWGGKRTDRFLRGEEFLTLPH